MALLLAEHGADIVVNDLYADRADKVAAEIEALGRKTVPAPFDVTDAGQVSAMAKEAGRLGTVEIIVNNAGVPPLEVALSGRKLFAETTPDEWEPYIRLNLYGVMYVTRAFIEGMIETGWGRVVTIISDAARTGDPRLAAYAAAKAGAAGFMRTLASEVGRHGVTANCVALGGTKTENFLAAMPEELIEKASARYPIRRLAEPEEVARVVLFLCSNAASIVTGQTYAANGGYSYTL